MTEPRLEDLYDDATVERLEAWARREADRVADAPLPVRQRAAASVFVASIGLGLQAVLEPEKADPIIEEVDAHAVDPGEAVVLVWTGEPRSTRALVRPWLLRAATGS